MDDQSSELVSLEQLFIDVLNPLKVNQATVEITRLISHPEFIITLISLAEITKNARVRYQCSIHCFHMLKNHVESYSLDFLNGLLSTFFLFVEQPNHIDYFVFCIEKLAVTFPELQHRVIEYIENRYSMPDFYQLIQTNPSSFVQLMHLLLFLYPTCKSLQSIDFSPILIFCFQNNAILSNQVIIYCIKFLRSFSYLHNDPTHKDEKEKLLTINQNYMLSLHLFCQLPFFHYFDSFWKSAIDFIAEHMLSIEDSQYLHTIALELLTSNQSEIKTTRKILLLSIFSTHIDDFEPSFVLRLFEISFQLFNQILTENSVLPIEYLSIFEEIFTYKKQSFLNIELQNQIFTYLKTQLLSEELSFTVKSSSITLLSMISDSIIVNDFEFYIGIIAQSFESNISIIQESACINISSINENRSIPFKKKLFDSIPLFVHKIIQLLMEQENSSTLFQLFLNSFIDLCEIEHSFGDWGQNSVHYQGLFSLIFELAPAFSTNNFTTFLYILFLTFRLDPTVDNDHVTQLYHIIIASFENQEDEKPMIISFSLLSSILERNNQAEYAFTSHFIQSIIRKSQSNFLIHQALTFVLNTLSILRESAGKFGSACIEFLFPLFHETESTQIKIDIIKILALTSKYTSNAEGASFVAKYVIKQMERERFSIKDSLLKYCQKIIKLLDLEAILQLFTIANYTITEETSSSKLKCESIGILFKICKSFALNDSQLIDIRKIISQLISELNTGPDADLNRYNEYIIPLSKLIAEVWKYDSPSNIQYFDFFLNYIQVYLKEYREKPEFFEFEQFEISEVVSTMSDAFEMTFLDSSSQEIIYKVIDSIMGISKIAISEELKMNICFLLGKLINLDINIVIRFIDQFLINWFHETLGNNPHSDLIPNLSFLFFKILNKTKPIFPSSLGFECIKVSIHFFPSFDRSSNTKLLFNQIMECFFNSTNISMLLKEDQIYIELYSLIILSFAKFLQMNENDIIQCDMDQNDVSHIKTVIGTLFSQFPAIYEHVSTSMMQNDFQQLLLLIQKDK